MKTLKISKVLIGVVALAITLLAVVMVLRSCEDFEVIETEVDAGTAFEVIDVKEEAGVAAIEDEIKKYEAEHDAAIQEAKKEIQDEYEQARRDGPTSLLEFYRRFDRTLQTGDR